MVFDEIPEMTFLVAFQLKVFMQEVLGVNVGGALHNRFNLWFDDIGKERNQGDPCTDVMVPQVLDGL